MHDYRRAADKNPLSLWEWFVVVMWVCLALAICFAIWSAVIAVFVGAYSFIASLGEWALS